MQFHIIYIQILLDLCTIYLISGKKVVRLGQILLIYFFMFVIFKMDFKDKSNEIYGYPLKVTGIYISFLFIGSNLAN